MLRLTWRYGPSGSVHCRQRLGPRAQVAVVAAGTTVEDRLGRRGRSHGRKNK